MADDAVGGGIFEGKRFWVAQRVPTRSTFCNTIRAHGGTTVILESNADYLIADHARPHAAPVGSISWKWIDASVQKGSLADIEEHRAGPAKGYVRPPGSLRPAKSSREKFTDEDDLYLWRWVKDAEAKGAALKGNAIYTQLEATNNRHTALSWRDRWIKYVSIRAPPPGANDAQPLQVEAGSSTQIPQSTAPEARLTSSNLRASNSPPPPPSTAPARQSRPLPSEAAASLQGQSTTATKSPPASSGPKFRQPRPPPVSSFTVQTSEQEEDERIETIFTSDQAHSELRAVSFGNSNHEEDQDKVSSPSLAKSIRHSQDSPGTSPSQSDMDLNSKQQARSMPHKDARHGTPGSSDSQTGVEDPSIAQRSPRLSASESPPALRRTPRKTRPVNYSIRLSPSPIDDRPPETQPTDARRSSTPVNTNSSPPHAASNTHEQTSSEFTEAERKFLWFEANSLVCAMSETPDEYQRAWQALHKKFPSHTADEWQYCWEQEVLPDIKTNENIQKAVTGLDYVRLPVSRRASAHFRAEPSPDRSAATRARHSAGATLDTAASQPLSASPRKRVRFDGGLEPSDTQQSIEFDTLPNGDRVIKQEIQEADEGPFRSALKRSAPSEESHVGKKRRTQLVSLVSDDEDDDSQRNINVQTSLLQNGDFSIYQDDGLVEDDKENVRSSPMRHIVDELHSGDRLAAFGDENVDFELVAADALGEQTSLQEEAVEEPETQDSGQQTITTESEPSQYARPRSSRVIADSTLGSPPPEDRESESPSSDIFLDAAQTQSDLQPDNTTPTRYQSARESSMRSQWEDTQAFLDRESLEPDLDIPLPSPDPRDEFGYLPSIEGDIEDPQQGAVAFTRGGSQSLFVSERDAHSPLPASHVAIPSARHRRTATHHDSSPPIPEDMDEDYVHGSIQRPHEEDFDDEDILITHPADRAPQIETQAFLDADTQDVDLTLPLPAPFVADASEDPAPHTNGDSIPDEVSQASSFGDDPVLARWFEGQRLADTDDNIFRAFEATNGDLKLAAQLLVLWRRGRPTPRDVRGVFHEDHDAMLLGTDARAVRRVYELHGRDAADERLRRLEERHVDEEDDV